MADVIPSLSNQTKHFLSDKVSQFTESVIREMTRQAMLYGAVNLAQGFPDFAAPAEVKQAARAAIDSDVNQYAITWGAKNLRNAIARQMGVWQGIAVDPEKEITVCCGSTEAMISTLLAVCNTGDEVVIFEPFYENYGPDAVLSGARPQFVKLRPSVNEGGEWTFDEKELRAAFHKNTKAIILNTPNNPTGKVFTRTELELIRDLCVEFDVLAITDEIYEHILYDGTEHISMASLEGMRERTVTINGMSKTYSVTGWRVGWAVAPEKITNAIRKVHDFLTVGAPAPLQEAGAAALSLPAEYYAKLAEGYRVRRDRLIPALEAAGFQCFRPRGAYYVMTDISGFGFDDDVSFTKYLVKEIGVAAVPGSSFYRDARDGARQVRFAFCKKLETLAAAAERLGKLRGRR
ncbi:MAG TPA: aminotransferase class I/II-fold pyridoxal phosphate-dependent enzyme [Candidatus Dormibacteraeota bacterium]|jgi:aspartate/methionine/tyrosine aminotransferase|nr:aminotransferase class I/II-fold pyridoxal phosphate-dependent enzyme [Candidatus Dormibacteraeota bacterium]